MITPYTIDNSAWVAITAAGKYGKAWLDVDNDEAEGRVDIRIFHTDGAPSDSDLTNSPKIFKPNDNVQFMELIPDTPEDIFYARAFNNGDIGQVLTDELVGTAVLPGKQDVRKQDQTTPPVEYFLTRFLNDVIILNSQTSRENTLVLQAGHLVAVGDFIEIYHNDVLQGPRYSQLLVVSLSVNTIRVGSFIGYNLDPSTVEYSRRTSARMNVVGTIDAPIKFGVSPPNGTSGLKWHLTRLIIGMILDSEPDDSKFGDIVGGVTNGIFFGIESTAFDYYLVNVRVNAGFRGSAYDVNYVPRDLPAGSYGESIRKSFNGDDKYGVVVSLDGALQEEFVMYIQDDLSSFIEFGVKIMGHIVED